MNLSLSNSSFVILSDAVPELLIDLKYCTSDNLIGRPLRSYPPNGVAVLTEVAAKSLKNIAKEIQNPQVKKQLNLQNPTLMVYEAYRPLTACQDFWEWSHSACEKTKKEYYPNIEKRDFFKLGYIVLLSSHARGSTVDLTLGDYTQGKFTPIDMGTPFDFMDPLSHPDNTEVSHQAFVNRQFLKKLMGDFGWKGINQEWWHFTYQNESFTDTYFDFPVPHID